MFNSLHQRRIRQAGVNCRVSMIHAHIAVAIMPANHLTAWTFGYTKSLPRPAEHSP